MWRRCTIRVRGAEKAQLATLVAITDDSLALAEVFRDNRRPPEQDASALDTGL